MKKLLSFYFFFFGAFLLINPQGIQSLSKKIVENITDFIKNNNQIRYSIIRFDNSSVLSDLELQRFYHLIITPLENDGTARFKDLLTGFNNAKGDFDQSRINEVNHFISIKLQNNKGKLGAGIVIYNRNLERVVHIRYFEEPVNQPEIELLGIKDPGLSSSEYTKIYDVKVNYDLLNLSSINLDGTEYLFLLSEDKIDVHTLSADSIKKKYSHKIEWSGTYFPAIQNEGSLFLLKDDENIFLIAGSNFSKNSAIYKYENSEIKKISDLDFSAVGIMKINGIRYISGFNYNYGKNYYKGELFLKQFNSSDIQNGETFVKILPDFYSAAFYKQGDEFISLYMIDLDYKLKIFTDTISDAMAPESKFGSAISISENLIAVSDYVENNDRLKIFKIGEIRNNPIFNKEIEGSIKIIKNGIINGKTGFWVIVEDGSKEFTKLRLQFWRKNID